MIKLEHEKCIGKIFRIAGVCGSGKTTITALLSNLSRETSLPYRRIDTAKILCELMGVSSEKQYREISLKKRQSCYSSLVHRITAIADANPEYIWFFERHLCSMSETDGNIIERGVPDEHGMRMIGIAVLVAHQEQVFTWRDKDLWVRKDRQIISAARIAEEQTKEIELAFRAKDEWGFPVRLFFNRTEQSNAVAMEILSFMREIIQ